MLAIIIIIICVKFKVKSYAKYSFITEYNLKLLGCKANGIEDHLRPLIGLK